MDRKRQRQTVGGEGAVEVMSARDEQMERLYRYYKAQDNITIDSVPDGTTVVVVSDLQYPFLDEPWWNTMERFIRATKPDVLFFNGDVIDAFEISDFDKRPNRLWNLDDEERWVREMLQRVGRWAKTIYWVDGNHEDRMRRTIWKNAEGFEHHVSDLAEALKLDELTAGFVPYRKHIEYLGFVVTHGHIVRKWSAYSARAHWEAYQSSGCNGHTHRIGSFSRTDMHGKTQTWYELGCQCRIDMEYGTQAMRDWQHGFLVGQVWDNALHTHSVREIGGGFSVNGEHFKVRG